MVGRDTLVHLTYIHQTAPKAIETLLYHRNTGPSDIQAESAREMEGSQCEGKVAGRLIGEFVH